MENQEKKPVFKYEPGELERTRKNLGFVDSDEAKKIADLLGGEVGLEKSAPIDEKAIKKVRDAQRNSALRNNSSGNRERKQEENTNTLVGTTPTEQPTVLVKSVASSPVVKSVLPHMEYAEKLKIDKIMMDPVYKIKNDYGFFNFFVNLRKGNQDRVASQFVGATLSTYVFRLTNLYEKVLQLISLAPKHVQGKIDKNDEMQYRLLRKIREWAIPSLTGTYKSLEKRGSGYDIQSLIPVTRQIYRMILSCFYLGEKRFIEYGKLIYAEIQGYPEVNKNTLKNLVQDIFTEWLYVYQRVAKGMYPLLLRMTCNEYCDYTELMTKKVSKVFSFLDITKYDILLPQKSEKEDKSSSKPVVKEVAEKDEETVEEDAVSDTIVFPESVHAGLKVLDTIFPGAGWLDLANTPDFYPFYQPLYRFGDGFNIMSPQNPLQVLVILLKILEDLFEGCRQIAFSESTTTGLYMGQDLTSVTQVIADWGNYREVVFEKLYLPTLRNFSNHLYSQRDFDKNQYGKRLISNLQWHALYNFLPYMKFEQLLIEKPKNESKYIPLPRVVHYLVTELKKIITEAEEAAKHGTPYLGIKNLYGPYKFEIPNVVSQRINVLLGAQKKQGSKATNFNLLKYTYAIVSVLDWWVNDKNSLAYRNKKNIKGEIWRVAEDGQTPIFSVDERSDQNVLFAKSLKSATKKNSGGTAKIPSETSGEQPTSKNIKTSEAQI